MAAAPSSPGEKVFEELASAEPRESTTAARQQRQTTKPLARIPRMRAVRFPCPHCSRTLRARIGLISHLRTHVLNQPPLAKGAAGSQQNHQVQSLPCAPMPAAPAASDDAARGKNNCQVNDRGRERVTFGGYGEKAGLFKGGELRVTLSEEGEVFVADWDDKRIKVFTLKGTFVRQFPTIIEEGLKMVPMDLAVDGEGNLWVVGCNGPDIVVQYSNWGRKLSQFELQKTGYTRGVAVDVRRNHILVTQTTGEWPNCHGDVQVFRPGGTMVRTFGQQEGMANPMFITVSQEGYIFVSDCLTHFVYVYNGDGQFLFQFGGKGSGEGQLNEPGGICTDRTGNIIVADYGNSRVELFDKKGRFLKHITTEMEKPEAVVMTTQGQLVVTDETDFTVTVFNSF